MIRLNLLSIASGLSLIIHGFFIFQFKESKKIKEIYVVDLSSHREFRPKEIPQKKTKQIKNEPNKEITKKKEIKKEKDIIPIKKKEVKKIEKKKATYLDEPKVFEEKKDQKVEKVEKKEIKKKA